MDNVVHAMPRGPCTPQFTEYDTDMDISKCIVHVIRPCCVQSHGCLRQRTVPFIQETITSRSLSLFHCSLLPCKIKKKASTYSHSISVVKTSPNQEANTKKKNSMNKQIYEQCFYILFLCSICSSRHSMVSKVESQPELRLL